MKPEEPKLIVAIYLTGEQLDPKLVTRVIGVQPSRKQTKGERQITSTGHEFTVTLGLWALVVEFDSPSLDAHLAQLVGSLPSGVALSSIVGVEDAYVDVFVALASNLDGDAKCELGISPTVLKPLAGLGLPIRISVAAGRD